jgi:general nucleoside transport system permease protein
MDASTALFTVLIAMLGGAIRVTTPFLFVALGEMLTERSGRINLGLEGTLVLGAMTAYAFSFQTGSPWLGVLAAGCFGFLMGSLHATICRLPGVNDIAVGIALMLFGTGLAFFFGKPYIQPTAPRLPSIHLGDWTGNAQVAQALQINPLFLIGVALALFLAWALKNTEAAARALGHPVMLIRLLATACGGFLAGIGGAFLSLYYPGSWNEGLSSGQGLMAVALVIFARWNPIRCLWAAMLFGAAGAIGPALQSVGITQGYYFFNAAPYILTLFLMIGSAGSKRALRDAPGELSLTR